VVFVTQDRGLIPRKPVTRRCDPPFFCRPPHGLVAILVETPKRL